MLLIDSVYINMGGGLALLKYLVERLNERGVPFRLVVDKRVEGKFPEVKDQVVLEPSLKARREFYRAFPKDITSVFCFGNVPPPVRLNVTVYTYFHNINMLTLADCRGWKQKLKFFLKREYIRSIRKNSDEWFVQTSNTANELIRHLGISEDNMEIYPFYRPPVVKQNEADRTDYIFVGNDSGSKGHRELIAVWQELYRKGIDRTLHLTVSSDSNLYPVIEELSQQGVKIVNHGIIPTDELFELYSHCKATVYPSRNESFGLGIVEAMEAGCDVIGADLPYMNAVCTPSEVFDPFSSESILKAVLRYEKKPRHTYQHVRNLVDELIDEITE